MRPAGFLRKPYGGETDGSPSRRPLPIELDRGIDRNGIALRGGSALDRLAGRLAVVVVRDDGCDVDEVRFTVDQPCERSLGLGEVVVLAEEVGAI
jgi:hypothetical protein